VNITISFSLSSGLGDVFKLRGTIRKVVAATLANTIRFRVGTQGRGPNGVLKGYSTNPLLMADGPGAARTKPIIPTKGKLGRGMSVRFAYYVGGYRQYRQQAGLSHHRFILSNRGELWRDWKGGCNSNTGPVLIGFTRAVNSEAADKAADDGREDMFDISVGELEEVADEIQDAILEAVGSAIRQKSVR